MPLLIVRRCRGVNALTVRLVRSQFIISGYRLHLANVQIALLLALFCNTMALMVPGAMVQVKLFAHVASPSGDYQIWIKLNVLPWGCSILFTKYRSKSSRMTSGIEENLILDVLIIHKNTSWTDLRSIVAKDHQW